jgi:hypothetical protein
MTFGILEAHSVSLARFVRCHQHISSYDAPVTELIAMLPVPPVIHCAMNQYGLSLLVSQLKQTDACICTVLILAGHSWLTVRARGL